MNTLMAEKDMVAAAGGGFLSPLPPQSALLPIPDTNIVLHVHYHQQIWTAKNYREALESAFEGACGKGVQKRAGTWFGDAGIFLKKRNEHGYSTITMHGTFENLSLLAQITRVTGIRFRLARNELAIDLYPQDGAKDTAYTIRDRIAWHLYLLNCRGLRYSPYHGKEKTMRNGEFKGDITYYVHAIDKKLYVKENICIPGKYIASKGKVYARAKSDIWFSRLELTMFKPFLKREFPVTIEYHRMCKILAKFNINDWCAFKSCDYDEYTQAIRRYCSKDGKPFPRALVASGRGKATVEQIYDMKCIAEEIGAKHLKNTCEKRFTREVGIAVAVGTSLECAL